MAAEFDVFLSHHSGDKPWVIALKAALVGRGVKVWLDKDELRPGDLFVDALEQGIQVSSAVAVIVSPESLKSAWVKEETQRALILSNSSRPELRLIPCLLRNATLPGFLGNRHWVDFRDAASFENRVDDLCHGITGRKPERQAGTPEAVRPAVTEVTPSEITFLDRSITAVKKERLRLTLLRVCSPALGLGVGLLWAPDAGLPAPLSYLGPTLVTGLLGFGVTARKWAEHGTELKRLAAHRDALELCCQSFGPVCPDVVNAFNRFLRRRIGIDAPERSELHA
jgi:hypothetical protein